VFTLISSARLQGWDLKFPGNITVICPLTTPRTDPLVHCLWPTVWGRHGEHAPWKADVGRPLLAHLTDKFSGGTGLSTSTATRWRPSVAAPLFTYWWVGAGLSW